MIELNLKVSKLIILYSYFKLDFTDCCRKRACCCLTNAKKVITIAWLISLVSYIRFAKSNVARLQP